ncbi:MAG: HAD family hydrolase [Planctomycetota bacterium]|jgi:putative hydrolase of the HAD superfamily
MLPKFLYFDLGKVLVDFDVEQMFRQLGEVAGVDPARVEEVVFDAGLQQQYETGRISGSEFYEAFCRQTGTRPDYDALRRAGSEIFELKVSMLPVAAQLRQAGYRLGILSNTCESHWEFCTRRYRILSELFTVHALSYRIGVAKPEVAIFHAAAELAGVRPEEIFYVDDHAPHVAGARAAGFDAVQYTSTPQLAADLRSRGIQFNY